MDLLSDVFVVVDWDEKEIGRLFSLRQSWNHVFWFGYHLSENFYKMAILISSFYTYHKIILPFVGISQKNSRLEFFANVFESPEDAIAKSNRTNKLVSKYSRLIRLDGRSYKSAGNTWKS